MARKLVLVWRESASYVWRELSIRMAEKCEFSTAGTEVQLKLIIASYLQRENKSSTSWKHKFHMVGKRENGQFRCG